MPLGTTHRMNYIFKVPEGSRQPSENVTPDEESIRDEDLNEHTGDHKAGQRKKRALLQF